MHPAYPAASLAPMRGTAAPPRRDEPGPYGLRSPDTGRLRDELRGLTTSGAFTPDGSPARHALSGRISAVQGELGRRAPAGSTMTGQAGDEQAAQALARAGPGG